MQHELIFLHVDFLKGKQNNKLSTLTNVELIARWFLSRASTETSA